MFILALLAFATSCTPEDQATNDQQIDKADYQIPPNG